MTLYERAVLLDVGNNFAFQPHVRMLDGVALSVTLCNCYASVFCAGLGVHLPADVANKQLLYCKARPGEWVEVSRAEALRLANLHELVVPVAAAEQHGHIGVCVESPPEDPTGLYVTAAGARNHVRCKLEASFGFLNPVFFHRKVAS